MSRAGKFIPGGAGKGSGDGAPGAGRTGPIRAPAPGAPVDPAGKKPGAKGSSLIKPVAKSQRAPILVMSSVVCCLLVSFAWYEFAVVPAKKQALAAQEQVGIAQKQLVDAQEDLKKQQALQAQQQATLRATLVVNSKPPGASVTIGDAHKSTPATFSDLLPGKVTVVVHADGYTDYQQAVTVTADTPTDLGTIELVQQTGAVSFTSPQTDVEYSLTGPGGYSHQGQVPDKLDKLPLGDYQLNAWQHDWKLAPVAFAIHDQDDLKMDVKFPYANATIASVPSGATVREGNTVMGQTPLSLTQLHPGDLKLSVDLAPYAVQRFVLTVHDFGNETKTVTLVKGKDFVAASGIPMVWIPDGSFWAGKYEVRQSDFETIAGYNPSTFRGPNRPVETISWENAAAFCVKLTDYERKSGKLPAGYKYSLPTESQWSALSADADMEQAATSRVNTLSSTQAAGASEPNKYGIYDSLGNVWEWCLDAYDEKGNHSLRGGCWLSSASNFPTPETREAGGPKYADKFIGFRVVLVPE